MAFNIQCSNKGCRKFQEPKLEVATNNVICSECNQVIENIDSFTKVGMKSIGQILKQDGMKQAFAVSCVKCNFIDRPVLDGEKLICKKCGSEFTNLSKPFVLALKSTFRK